MTTETAQIYQVAQIREFEAIARQRYGFTGDEMMQRAGKAAFAYLLKRWPKAKNLAVFCGAGNNGGDGFVLARLARERGLRVHVFQIGNPDHFSAETRRTYKACINAGVDIQPFKDQTEWHTADVIVDAIYGIGLKGDVRQDAQWVIETINKSKIPILALDVPSGVDADTGAVRGIAIKAAATITFMGMKFGLVTGHGIAYVGDLHCDDLQLPKEIFSLSTTGILNEIHLNQFTDYLKPRRRDMHKGAAGHVLIIGGDKGHSGAPRLAAQAALRVGAGLVTVATHPSHAAVLNLGCPEIMCQGVTLGAALKPLIDKASIIAIGPGLGTSLWAKNLLKAVLATKLPLIVDADALNLLAKHPSTRANWVLTPHPGEAARLIDQTPQTIQADRLTALQQLQQRYHGICVLKGAGTLVAERHNPPMICNAGNPGMATAGMGDVLTGVIAGLVAQHIPLFTAAQLGVCLHAMAGDLAAAAGGERGLIATDLMPYLRQLVNLN